MTPASAVPPSPPGAEFFLDTRGEARSLRVRWHHSEGLVLLSLWRGEECTGTFRLAVDEVPTLVEALRTGLDAAYDLGSPGCGPRLSWFPRWSSIELRKGYDSLAKSRAEPRILDIVRSWTPSGTPTHPAPGSALPS